MKFAITLLVLILSGLSFGYSRPRVSKVAIIDTGLNIEDPRFKKLICGAKDFTGEGINDLHGHGTHIAGIIKQYAVKKHFCFVILKAFANNGAFYLVEALTEAYKQKVDIINISGGGPQWDTKEYDLISNHLNIRIIAAAGNNNKNLIESPYYPAMYVLPNVISVGALDENGSVAKYSNYGDFVKEWEIGNNILSTIPCEFSKNPDCVAVMSGTSMATAIYTAKHL